MDIQVYSSVERFRSRRPEVFYKKLFHKKKLLWNILENLHEKTVMGYYLSQVATCWGPSPLLKLNSTLGVFLWIFQRFLEQLFNVPFYFSIFKHTDSLTHFYYNMKYELRFSLFLLMMLFYKYSLNICILNIYIIYTWYIIYIYIYTLPYK